ncbi:MAG: hypothetical protein PHV16_03070 [Candidatus Nanoarchaeia archaeon]|nr:hypothetical protein [Candidatus Nanoarchaeia archaeon]
MKFKNTFSTKQASSIFFIIIGFFLLSVKPQEAYGLLRMISILIIILSVYFFWNESVRRYKILVPYKKNNYDSKAEKEIAAYFKRKNIIYNHHPNIKVPKTFWIFTLPFLNITLEPDFFLPEFNVFIEYWGLIENKDYKEKSYKFKKKLYKENDLELISLYPKNIKNLDFDFTSKLLEIMKEREGNSRVWR